jgi:hypothetical protein
MVGFNSLFGRERKGIIHPEGDLLQNVLTGQTALIL